MNHQKWLLALAISGLVGVAHAGEKEELLKLRNTTTNLIRQLVKQGVITDKMADEMIKQAEADAEQQAAVAKAEAAAQGVVPADEVRVAYVPDFVKDEIRQQVRSELREEVVGDVMAKAKNEQWGLPNALPEWTRKFKLSGDLRLRSQHDFMAENNISGPNTALFYPDVMAINDAGGVQAAGIDAAVNTSDDRQQFRQRLRLGIDAQITDSVSAGVRLATGNQRDPVSTNQTLGFTGQKYEFAVDRAYLKYEAVDEHKFKWLSVKGGRIANPFYTGGGEFTGGSEMVWDTDLSFEGAAATYYHNLQGGGLSNAGEPPRSLFFTAGAFPLQESARSSDKWLFGGQAGLDWGFDNQDNFKVGVAYYDYVNVQVKPNTQDPFTCDLNDFANNASRPDFVQGGNTLATICREGNSVDPASQTGLPGMLGLASDYNIVNINASYDFAAMAPYHVRLSGDYAKNIGFNSAEVSRLFGSTVDDQTSAWQLRLDYGWQVAERPGHWNVFAAYKYVERDAVLDGLNDSDFHLGGTNNKGWFIGGNYGLMKNVWLTGRWLTADVITGPPYGVDVLQVDINTRF
ncbi:putative porin [Methylomonas sp. SURF-2]|uniref:Porin n=1 Tax=Methylomonas subterranea TaxID=2952225 RepID=A0ABT1TFK1_9GAMM|nr:putative porin [Methylomonas sp. SURF-2]MCQ8103519.1 putative porin [Methylomonas sp. SURF-2]